MFKFDLSEITEKLLPEVKIYVNKLRTDLADMIRPPRPSPKALFETQWQRTKEALLEGSDLTHNRDGSPNPNKKRTMEIVLENTKKYLSAGIGELGGNNAGNVATLNKVILPVVRRVVPSLIANELIGVQAMMGPVSSIHVLRTKKSIDDRVSLHIIQEVVEAKSRKLSARWTFEAASASREGTGVDIEAEIMAALAQEIIAEYDCEVLAFLQKAAGVPTVTFDSNPPKNMTMFVGDLHDQLAKMIEAQAANIETRTKRGAGNWCVVNAKAALILKSATSTAFLSRGKELNPVSGVRYIGAINESIKVYCNTYAPETSPVLVGYKGNDIDSPAVFAPYIPLTSSGVVIDPHTFEPVVSFMTRYGFLEIAKSEVYNCETKDYLGLVGFVPEDLSSFV